MPPFKRLLACHSPLVRSSLLVLGTGAGSLVAQEASVTIMDIQGAAHTSPLLGEPVQVSGVVTAVAERGFYLQDPVGDNDPATSDALFVFTGEAPSVAAGDELEVAGEVSEFTPGGVGSGNLSTTQLVDTELSVLGSSRVLPVAVWFGASGRTVPTATIDDDAFAAFEPAIDGIDFFESLEAMRVRVPEPLAIAPTNRFGELYAVADAGRDASGLSQRQTLNISPDDFNPEKIQIDVDAAVLPGFDVPIIDTGAVLSDVTGVIAYEFGNFEVVPTEAFSVVESPIEPEITELGSARSALRIASYNVLNLDPNDTDEDDDADVADGRFATLADHVVTHLKAPDIIALQEIQDDDGSLESGVTTAGLTLQTLADAIVAAGGPLYAAADTEGLEAGSGGGQPGGNIRVAFLYNPDRVSLDSVRPLVDPADQASNALNPFFGSRISLVGEFGFAGETVTVINNHLSSKGGSAPIFGTSQPFDALQEDPQVNGSLEERRRQAEAVAARVDELLDADAAANVVVLGDLNEFEFVSPVSDILGARLVNTANQLADDERYSFIFQGNSQQLDHVLLSAALASDAAFDIVHVNAEFAATASRASDHDPLLVSLPFDAVYPDPVPRH